VHLSSFNVDLEGGIENGRDFQAFSGEFAKGFNMG
jgi:hypothetical protein